MIVRVEGLNLLPGAAELLDQCVDDLDKDGDASCAWWFMQGVDAPESWQDILQSLWKLSEDKGARALSAMLEHTDWDEQSFDIRHSAAGEAFFGPPLAVQPEKT